MLSGRALGGAGAGGGALGDRQSQLRALRPAAGKGTERSSPRLGRGTNRGCPLCPPSADPAARLRLRAFNTMDSEAGPGRAGPGQDGHGGPGTGTERRDGDTGTAGLGEAGPGLGGRSGSKGRLPSRPRIPSIPGAPPHPPALGADAVSEPPPGTGPVRAVNPSVFPPC